MFGVSLFKEMKAEEIVKLVLTCIGGVLLLVALGFYAKVIYDMGYKKAETKYGVYKTQYDQLFASHEKWVADSKEAQERYQKESQSFNEEIERRLKEILDAAKKPITIEKVTEYVPEEVDRNYALPTGLVWLYRDSLVEKAFADPRSDLPDRYSLDVGAPSQLAVSQFGLLAAYNNTECRVRGEVIQAWQDWYYFHKDKFDQVVRDQADGIPKTK